MDELHIDSLYTTSLYITSSNLSISFLFIGGNAQFMSTMVEKGFLGRKSGAGFYMYPKDAKKQKTKMLNPEVSFLYF